MRRLGVAALAALATMATAVASADELVLLEVPASVPWSGIAGAAAEGGTVAMLYPAPTPLLGLIAVLTHGAIISGARAAEDKRRQEEADKVLEPYLAALSAWSPKALVQAVAEPAADGPARRVAEGEASAGARWRVEFAPTFAMFAGRSRLLLDSRVRVLDAAVPGTVPFEVQVRVASNRRADDAAFPSDDDAELLKQESVRLLAHAVDVALHAHQRQLAALADDTPFRTHRYLDGPRDGMERAQLVGEGCARIVLRTLRGTLLSVPVRMADDTPASADCATRPYRFPVTRVGAAAAATAQPASASGSAAAR